MALNLCYRLMKGSIQVKGRGRPKLASGNYPRTMRLGKILAAGSAGVKRKTRTRIRYADFRMLAIQPISSDHYQRKVRKPFC